MLARLRLVRAPFIISHTILDYAEIPLDAPNSKKVLGPTYTLTRRLERKAQPCAI